MRPVKWFLYIFIFLVAVRVALPSICLRLINHNLKNNLGVYTGKITDFDLALYRGTYLLQGLEIKKKVAPDPALLRIAQIDLSLAWRALWQRRISADIALTHPHVFLVDSEKKQARQLGTEESKEGWLAALDTVIPMKIESLAVRDGIIEFTNRDFKQSIPIRIDQLVLETKNLRLAEPEEPSPLKFTARLQKHAQIEAHGSATLLKTLPNIDIDFKLLGFKPETINQTLRIYIPLDITKGLMNFYGEVATAQKQAVGYSKVFFKDGDIIAQKQRFIGFKHFIFEILGAFGHWILQNNKTKSVAAVVPFSFKNGKFDIDSSKAFWSAIKNMSTSFKPTIDHKVSQKNLGQIIRP